VLEKKQADGAELSKLELKALTFCNARLANLTKPQVRDRTARKLLRQIGFRERLTTRATSLPACVEQERTNDSWQLFDFVCSIVASGDLTQLQNWVANPALFADGRSSTAIVFTDQVPVWLKVEAGGVLVSEQTLAGQRAHKRARTELARAVDEDAHSAALSALDETHCDSTLVRGAGSTEAARWRVSLLARQAVEDFFQPLLVPRGLQCNHTIG